jgi:2-methylcitrate dehydratase PrpD
MMDAATTSDGAGAGARERERVQIADGLSALAAWAVDQVGKPLPAEVLAAAARVFIDDVAAMCAAHAQHEVVALHGQAAAAGASGGALLFAPGARRADRHDAAIANGTAGCWCELDEGYRGAACHAGLYVLPALLAEQRTDGLSMQQVLTLLAVGYEVNSRIAETWTFPGMTMHPHAAFANFGAAAGAALARGVPACILAAALRLAGGVVPAGAYQAAVEGALVRNLWTGLAASTGMRCVSWAEAGMDGYVDGPHPAFAGLLAASTRPGKLTEGMGSRWAILANYHKLHGCCHSTHAAVEAAIALRDQIDVAGRIADIAKVELFTHRPTMSNRKPSNSLAARFSFEHVLAVAMRTGSTGPSAFERAAVDDPVVARLREVTTLSPYEPLPAWPLDRAARIEMTLVDGKVLTTECVSAPGGPDQPLTDARLLAKAEALTHGDYPAFAALARRLVALDAGTLALDWATVGERLLGGARP